MRNASERPITGAICALTEKQPTTATNERTHSADLETGTRTARVTLKVPIRWHGGWRRVQTDVVAGNLPPLMGYDLQAKLKVVLKVFSDAWQVMHDIYAKLLEPLSIADP